MRYRPAGPPEDPVLREAWRQGLQAGGGGASCPTPAQAQRFERFSVDERRSYRAGMRAGISGPVSPIRFPAEVGLLAIEATIYSLFAAEEIHTALCAIPAVQSLGTLRTELEQQRARDLGLTPETAPQAVFGWDHALLGAGLALGRLAYLRLRGVKPAAPSWSFVFAQSLIRQIDRRRTWRRAAH
jgi:hypothetical protein